MQGIGESEGIGRTQGRIVELLPLCSRREGKEHLLEPTMRSGEEKHNIRADGTFSPEKQPA